MYSKFLISKKFNIPDVKSYLKHNNIMYYCILAHIVLARDSLRDFYINEDSVYHWYPNAN